MPTMTVPIPDAPLAPPSMPMLQASVPLVPDDLLDIPDPVVPPDALPPPVPPAAPPPPHTPLWPAPSDQPAALPREPATVQAAQDRAVALCTALETQALYLEDLDPSLLTALRGWFAPATAPAATAHAHEALLHGFLEALQTRLRAWLVAETSALDRREDQRMTLLKDWVQAIGGANEHASYQLSAALHELTTTGLCVLSPPYQAQVHAVSPEGFGVTLTLSKPGTAEGKTALVEELFWLTGWLAAQGYTAPVAVAP